MCIAKGIFVGIKWNKTLKYTEIRKITNKKNGSSFALFVLIKSNRFDCIKWSLSFCCCLVLRRNKWEIGFELFCLSLWTASNFWHSYWKAMTQPMNATTCHQSTFVTTITNGSINRFVNSNSFNQMNFLESS